MRILAVGHPASVAANQEPYAVLLREGVDVQVVVPDRWRRERDGACEAPALHPSLEGRVHPSGLVLPGSIQRHVHLPLPGRWLARQRPDVVFIDAEHSSIAAAQWVHSARRRRIPIAVKAWDNIDRPLPWPARAVRHSTLRATSGVLAGTPAAARWARTWGASGPIHVAPPAVMAPATTPARNARLPFTVGFVGPLVEAKGIPDLLAAADRLPEDTRLLIAGDGPLHALVADHPKVDLRVGVPHDDMASVYAEMDVLVLPSRTTRTWSERLGRVLLEAMAQGRPVIASASGEIPWVLSEARGGMTFPEGDVAALAGLIVDVRTHPESWRELGERGRRDVAERFSPEATAAVLLALATDLSAPSAVR